MTVDNLAVEGEFSAGLSMRLISSSIFFNSILSKIELLFSPLENTICTYFYKIIIPLMQSELNTSLQIINRDLLRFALRFLFKPKQ